MVHHWYMHVDLLRLLASERITFADEIGSWILFDGSYTVR